MIWSELSEETFQFLTSTDVTTCALSTNSGCTVILVEDSVCSTLACCDPTKKQRKVDIQHPPNSLDVSQLGLGREKQARMTRTHRNKIKLHR